MSAFADNYFGLEKKAESQPVASNESIMRRKQETEQEVEAFIDASGMPRWLAKIAFHEHIQMIRESGE